MSKISNEEKRKTKEIKALDNKATSTAFILMFPSLILAGMAALSSTVFGSLLAVSLAIYQFLMLKKFIIDYYNLR